MGSIGKKVKQIVDPANFFGGRSGGVNLANAYDPGGAIIKTITGSDIGRKIGNPLTKVADPFNSYITKENKVNFEPKTIPTYQEKREQRIKKESNLAEMQKRKRARSVLQTKSDYETFGG
jgi:hypothetical protein